VRHLYGAALAVGMVLVMFFGGAWGYLRLLRFAAPLGQTSALPAGGGSLLSNSTALLALAVLVVTAVLAGLLAAIPRISPLASGLPGLLLLAWTALYLVSARKAVTFIPLRSHAFGAGWEELLFNGILGAAGAVMVFPLFIPSRWRSRRQAETESLSRDVDDYLTGVTADSRTRQEQAERELEDWDREDQALVGTVLTRPAATSPVDTSHVTGASRALRNTGSLRMTPGPGTQPRTTGSMPRDPFRRPPRTDR
jgi:hypothetical protein